MSNMNFYGTDVTGNFYSYFLNQLILSLSLLLSGPTGICGNELSISVHYSLVHCLVRYASAFERLPTYLSLSSKCIPEIDGILLGIYFE